MKTKLSIEESAKLIELGVDAKLASEREFVDKTEKDSNQFLEIEEYPLFSLTDLLSILPKEVDGYMLNISTSESEWWVAYELTDNCDEWYSCVRDVIGTFGAPELIDALNQLAIWVIEQWYLKTEKK